MSFKFGKNGLLASSLKKEDGGVPPVQTPSVKSVSSPQVLGIITKADNSTELQLLKKTNDSLDSIHKLLKKRNLKQKVVTIDTVRTAGVPPHNPNDSILNNTVTDNTTALDNRKTVISESNTETINNASEQQVNTNKQKVEVRARDAKGRFLPSPNKSVDVNSVLLDKSNKVASEKDSTIREENNPTHKKSMIQSLVNVFKKSQPSKEKADEKSNKTAKEQVAEQNTQVKSIDADREQQPLDSLGLEDITNVIGDPIVAGIEEVSGLVGAVTNTATQVFNRVLNAYTGVKSFFTRKNKAHKTEKSEQKQSLSTNSNSLTNKASVEEATPEKSIFQTLISVFKKTKKADSSKGKFALVNKQEKKSTIAVPFQASKSKQGKTTNKNKEIHSTTPKKAVSTTGQNKPKKAKGSQRKTEPLIKKTAKQKVAENRKGNKKGTGIDRLIAILKKFFSKEKEVAGSSTSGLRRFLPILAGVGLALLAFAKILSSFSLAGLKGVISAFVVATKSITGGFIKWGSKRLSSLKDLAKSTKDKAKKILVERKAKKAEEKEAKKKQKQEKAEKKRKEKEEKEKAKQEEKRLKEKARLNKESQEKESKKTEEAAKSEKELKTPVVKNGIEQAKKKLITKSAGKSLAKKAPLAGLAVGVALALGRANDKEYVNALLEFLSGLSGSTAIGVPASVAIDSVLLNRDIKKLDDGGNPALESPISEDIIPTKAVTGRGALNAASPTKDTEKDTSADSKSTTGRGGRKGKSERLREERKRKEREQALSKTSGASTGIGKDSQLFLALQKNIWLELKAINTTLHSQRKASLVVSDTRENTGV